MPRKLSKIRKSRKRADKNRASHHKRKPKHNPEKWADLLYKFPDTSRDGVVADARAYKTRASIRIEKAEAKRKRRATNRYPRPVNY